MDCVEYGKIIYNHNNPGSRLFVQIIKELESDEADKIPGKFWTDGEKILCKDEAAINGIADLCDDLAGYGMCCTGYYDPEEDARTGCTDKYTGYYYLELAE